MIAIIIGKMKKKYILSLSIIPSFSPVNFLSSFKNRFTIAATFGATATTCLSLFLGPQYSFFSTSSPGWLKGELEADRFYT